MELSTHRSGGVGDPVTVVPTFWTGVSTWAPLPDLLGKAFVPEMPKPAVFMVVACGVFSRLEVGDGAL
jgi:hypothetical protein